MKIICTTIAVSLLIFPLHKRCLSQHSLGACSPSGDTCSFFTINLNSTMDSCNTCEGTASVSIIGGTGPFTYFWFPTGQTTSLATGLCAGTYTIQVSDSSGNTCYCSIAVTSPPPLTTTCSANPDTVVFGNSTQLLVVPSGGISPYSYYWTPPNNLNNPTISNPIDFPPMSICYIVTVTDSFSCTDTCQICVIVDSTVGLEHIYTNRELIIYPNPAKREITIEMPEARSQKPEEKYIVRIKNSLGQEIFQQSFPSTFQHSNIPSMRIDTSPFQKGLYVVEVCTLEGVVCHTEKVVVE